MWIQTIVHEACPICGPEMELHTYRCVDCGPVKTTSLLLRPVDCRERRNGFWRGSRSGQGVA